MNRSAARCFAVAPLLLAFVGCVQESSEGPSQTFSYELWVPVSVLLAGVIAAPAGWSLRKVSSRLGWGLLIFGLIAALFFAPSLFRDRAVVDDTTFSLRTGIWGLSSVHEVKYENLKNVRIVSEEVSGRRGSKRTNTYMLCEQNDGMTSKVPINNKVAEAAAPHFLNKVSERGIPIVDET